MFSFLEFFSRSHGVNSGPSFVETFNTGMIDLHNRIQRIIQSILGSISSSRSSSTENSNADGRTYNDISETGSILIMEDKGSIHFNDDDGDSIYEDAIDYTETQERLATFSASNNPTRTNDLDDEEYDPNEIFYECEKTEDDADTRADISKKSEPQSVEISEPNIIETPAVVAKTNIFDVSSDHQAIIKDMMLTMDASSVMSQGAKLKAHGAQIKNVHPFAFLKVVLSDDESKKHIKSLQSAGKLKFIIQQAYSGFLYGDPFESASTRSGFLDKLKKMHDENDLTQYTEELVKGLSGLEKAKLDDFIQKGQWKEFTDYIIKNVK